MFLGVVGRLISHRAFSGKVLLDRVSEPTYVGRLTVNTSFSGNVLINCKIKGSEWSHLFDRQISLNVGDILEDVSLHCGLEINVSDRFELLYTTCVGYNGNTKEVKLDYDKNINGILH